MTAPVRRVPGRSAVLSPRSRAVLASRLAGHAQTRPKRRFGQIVLAVIGIGVIGVAVLGVFGAIAGVGVINALAQGLPDPANLATLQFSQPTIIYDRTGKVELARFEREKRRVVTYDEIPKLVIDAVTTAEDRSFWENDGFDPAAIGAAVMQNVSGDGSGERGASTITQQLVRARLLPSEVTQGDRYMRKVLEIIQSARLTGAFPGEAGKAQVITAYLNEVYFGHQAYGIAAAAEIYFGVTDLNKLTPAQAALLASVIKAPAYYDPYNDAVKGAGGKLTVPKDAAVMMRRDYVLQNLSTSRWTHLTPAQTSAALAEPATLYGAHARIMRAPHFSWQVRHQLEQLLGGAEQVETGGYKVITSLDWTAQQLAERDVAAAAIAPNIKSDAAEKLLDTMKIPKADRHWIAGLRGKDLHNGLLVAVDYRHGDVLAYVGSAGYYRADLTSPKFSPEYDGVMAGRQPGSSFKPIVYGTAFDRKVLDPGSVLLDISTNFGGGWEPKDADEMERGPILVRNALQQSLNLPTIRALQMVGNEAVADMAANAGIDFIGGRDAFLQGGLASAIGTVEVRPLELASAFGMFPNGGVHVPPRLILSVTDASGKAVYTPPVPEAKQVISAEAAFLMSDILAGNSDPKQNPVWATALALHNTKDGSRRPAAAKTGTTDDVRDLATYGFLAPPEDPASAGLAVGVWLGNSDHSKPRTSNPANSLAAANMWRSFVRDYTKNQPLADFKPPKGVVESKIDAWSGGEPGPWTRATKVEWFQRGSEPGSKHPTDAPGLLYSPACGGWRVDPVKAERGPSSWKRDVDAWVERAHRGTGVKGPYGSTTAYQSGQSSWGGPLIGSCSAPRHAHGGGGSDGSPPPKRHRRHHRG